MEECELLHQVIPSLNLLPDPLVYVSLVQLAKLEKILKHIKAVDSVIPNKLTLADVTIINTYVYFCDAKTNGEEIFKQNCPTAFKIVEAVMKDDKIAAMVNEAKKVPYLPW